MTTRNLSVVTAGLSRPSSTRMLADRLAEATVGALHQLGVRADVQVIELRDLAHDITNNLLTGFPGGNLRPAVERLVRSDGLIGVTPIFSASYSGLFKSFFDTLEENALAGKPVLIAATGGTERHSLALEHAVRPMFVYLRSIVVPTAVYAASSDWGEGDRDGSPLARRVERAAGELADLMSKGDRYDPEDPYDDPTPFSRLLADNDTPSNVTF